jgi:hypothetical protein
MPISVIQRTRAIGVPVFVGVEERVTHLYTITKFLSRLGLCVNVTIRFYFALVALALGMTASRLSKPLGATGFG